ncbi:hypothetical protein HY373_01420 [Candidatus Berkelbacteria bacterium]|nr:hypothetical protein [Candidatus Berkelbacteria bacterium]
MKTIAFILIFWLILILQVSVAPHLAIFGATLSLPLLFSLWLLWLKEEKLFFWFLPLLGIFLDLISGFFFGFFTLSFLVIGFLVQYLWQKEFFKPAWLAVFLLYFLAGFLLSFFDFLFLSRYSFKAVLLSAFYLSFVGEGLYFLSRTFLEKYAAAKGLKVEISPNE